MSGGRYEGDLVVLVLDDGRRVKLTQPFAYFDPADLPWPVPRNAIVDGASIPRALWTLIGGPFEGKYRNASVIHDWYCDRRNRPWQDVHRMFHHAMLTSGVDALQARVMYAGVRWGGPRWSETVVHNAQLGEPSLAAKALGAVLKPFNLGHMRPVEPSYRAPLDASDVERLAEEVAGETLSLDDIDALVDAHTALLAPQASPT